MFKGNINKFFNYLPYGWLTKINVMFSERKESYIKGLGKVYVFKWREFF